jgi:hypothetical protein
MTTTIHTIDEALSSFELIAGPGSESEKKACAMTLLAWISGQGWTDHPSCAHRILSDAVIRGNDAEGTTKKMKAELVRSGQDGVLDTWWIPGEVIAWSLSHERDKPAPTRYEQALSAIQRIAEWKANKTRPVLRSADLSGADLSGADLRSADLSGAVLSGAVLRSADLSGAVLRSAVLRSAVLRSADLSGAVLRSADLSGADLSGAVLRSADLRSADLSGAVLSGAVLRSARGNAFTALPPGYKVNEAGLIVKTV